LHDINMHDKQWQTEARMYNRLIKSSLKEVPKGSCHVLPELPTWVPARDSLYLCIASNNEA
jgi:hypothetical protein